MYNQHSKDIINEPQSINSSIILPSLNINNYVINNNSNDDVNKKVNDDLENDDDEDLINSIKRLY